MPQLPSGRHVAISLDELVEWAEQRANFADALKFFMQYPTPETLEPLVDIVYFRSPAGMQPGGPYLAGWRIPEIDSPACEWDPGEKAAFRNWLQSAQVRRWLENQHERITTHLRAKELPENLRGIMDGD